MRRRPYTASYAPVRCVGPNGLRQERRQALSMRVDALAEPVVALVHRRQSLVHRVAAWIEPAIDRKTMPFSDVHRFGTGRCLAFIERRERCIVNRALFGPERLP